MKKGARKAGSKWGDVLDLAAAMEVGSYFLFAADRRLANRLRAMLEVSARTASWQFALQQIECTVYAVHKVRDGRVTASEHATWSRYAKGCRCEGCRRVGAAYLREYRRKRNQETG